jgi:hypothetical protein
VLSAADAADKKEVRRSQTDSWAVARVGALLASRWRDPEAPPIEAVENQFLPYPVPVKAAPRIVSARTAKIYQRLMAAGTISDFAIGVLAPIAKELQAAAKC